MTLVSRKKSHVETRLIEDPPESAYKNIPPNNFELEKSRPKQHDKCAIILALIAFVLTAVIIFSPSTMINLIRSLNHFQNVVNLLETLTTTRDVIVIDEKELQYRKDEMLNLQADISAKQYETERLRIEVEKKKARKRDQNTLTKIIAEIQKEALKNDNFCYDCPITLGTKRYSSMTCSDRLEYLIKKYQKTEDKTIIEIMNDNPECMIDPNEIKNKVISKDMEQDAVPKEEPESTTKNESEGKMIRGQISRFCSDCGIILGGKKYHGMTCRNRLDYIVEKYGYDVEDTKISIMNDNPECVARE